MTFNRQSRATSMFRASGVGTICHILNVVAGFAYRTAFIALLSERYLGINGLFWDVFRLLALAELGVGSAICYRFYKPIAGGDVVQVGRLMRFFRQVYFLVALVVLVLGLALFPFVRFLVRDASDVPCDVNLNIVYLLFLAQSVSTYLFSYRLSIWNADRKNHVALFASMVSETGRFAVQILVLWLTKSFVGTLASGIAFVLSFNWILSVWTTRRYAPVFAVAEDLPRAQKVGIFKDAGALMLHRIGGTVVNSTDSIILSKFVGLAAVGLYSNYALLVSALTRLLNQFLGVFTSNYGNAYATLPSSDVYHLFRKMQFLNLALSGFAATGLFLLVGPFIRLWLGARFCLGTGVEAVICLLFYLRTSWSTVGENVTASGLFVRDKPRPIVEAMLNVAVSVVLVRSLGLTGVFLGTIVSYALTSFWRGPYLLFRHRFGRTTFDYWRQYAALAALPVAFASGVRSAFAPAPVAWVGWIGWAVAISVAYAVCFAALYGWTADCRAVAVTLRARLAPVLWPVRHEKERFDSDDDNCHCV